MFPIIGNHEAHPSNLYAPHWIDDPSLSTRPLYEFLAHTWNWLPADALATIKIGGYYTTLIAKGLRLIVLNNNVCFQYNVWLLLNSSYVSEELQWLHDTLLNAEKNDEHVHVLAHVPSGDRHCFMKWAHEFNRIVQRFSKTISAQFNGHTHKDQFYVYYGPDGAQDQHAINVAWNGGSATSYTNVNPNYRVYTVETESFVSFLVLYLCPILYII